MEKKPIRRPRKDYRRLCGDIVSTGLLVFGVLAVAVPLINHDVSAQVLTVAAGGELTCPGSAEISHDNKPADAIAILGAGMRLTDYGVWVDNKYEEERLDAGAGLIVAGLVKPGGDIIILDGQLPQGAGKKVSENYLIQKVADLSSNVYGISQNQITVDNESVNTPTGMDVLLEWANAHNGEHILIVTHANHVQRAELDAYLRGLCNISFMSVEEYNTLFNPSFSEVLNARNNSADGKIREIKEEAAFLLHMYDPTWTLRTIYKTNKTK